jgi:hypothetical protein
MLHIFIIFELYKNIKGTLKYFTVGPSCTSSVRWILLGQNF